MKATILRTGLILAVLATTTFGASQKMTCRVTGKTMDKCCCETRVAGEYGSYFPNQR